MLNTATRKAKAAAEQLGRWVGVSRTAPVRAAPVSSIENVEDEDDEDASNNGDDPPRLGESMTLDDQEDRAVSYPTVSASVEEAGTSFPRASTPSPLSRVTFGPNNPAKRKRVSSKPDVYEVPSTDDEAEVTVKGPIKKLAKRSHPNSKAKEPIVAFKKSNDQCLPTSSRQTRAAKAKEEIALAIQPPENATLNEDTGSKIKRGRGRPRKERPLTRDNEEEPAAAVAEVSAHQFSANIIAGEVGSISGILLDPSPVKVSAPPATTDTPASDDDELPDVANIGQVQHTVQKPSEAVEEEINTPRAPRSENVFLDFELLNRILETAKHVGHRLQENTQDWEPVRTGVKLKTGPGKEIDQALQHLITHYKKLKGWITTKSLDDIQRTNVKITSLVHSIKEKKSRILSKSLGNPALGIEYLDADSTQPLLIDLYFNILPKLLKCIKLAALVYDENGNINTPHLIEFADLIEVHYRLATTAIGQPKSSQPRQSQLSLETKSASFQIKRPTQVTLSLMRDLRQKIRGELNSRAAAEKAVESLKLAEEHEKKLQRQEQIDNQERRRRRKEIYRKQREDIARQQEDPIWGPILMEQMARDQDAQEAKQALEKLKKPRVKKTRVTEPRLRDEENTQDDSFEDDQCEQRVSDFPSHNLLRKESPQWSDEMMTTFLNYLRTHDGIVLFI